MRKILEKKQWLIACFFFISCNATTKYQVGFFLYSIQGAIVLTPLEKDFVLENCFVLVLANQNIGISLEEPIYTKQAYIEKVDASGNYQFSPANKGQIFDLSFFCPGFQRNSARFSQTLGVGKIIYSPQLKKDNAWKDSYQFFIRAFLEDILSEERYLLSDSDVFFLSTWLEQVERGAF